MRKAEPQSTWPDVWRESYNYDLVEVYGQRKWLGYKYAYESRREVTMRLIAESVPIGSRILDIAAAQGNFSLALAEMGYDVTWNDLREELIPYVQLKHERGTICYKPGNVFELEFDAPFDAVLITEIIEHVAHPDEFLSKVANLVKPGGVIIMSTPNGAYFRNHLPKFSECEDPSVFETIQFKPNSDGHIFLLHPEELQKLAEYANLTVEKTILFTNPLTNGHMKTSVLLKLVPKAAIFALERCSRVLPTFIGKKTSVQMAVTFRVLK